MVIASHFHYDHIGGLRFFRNAKVYVQNNELRAARHPDMGMDRVLRKQYFDHPLDFETVMGDTEIVPGVWVLQTYGHTPGHQSLLVELPSGPMIFSGDAIHVWENAEKERPFNGFYNLQDAYRVHPPPEDARRRHEGHPRPQPRPRPLGNVQARAVPVYVAHPALPAEAGIRRSGTVSHSRWKRCAVGSCAERRIPSFTPEQPHEFRA